MVRNAGDNLRVRSPGQGPWNALVSITENSTETFGFGPKDAQSRYARLGLEAMATTLGPMPVEDFLDTFLSCPDLQEDTMPSFVDAFALMAGAETETALYLPLITALNEDLNPKSGSPHGARCPGFTFVQTANRPDKSDGNIGSVKPDICCYANDHLRQAVGTDGKFNFDDETDMGFAAIFIEVKATAANDFFDDIPIEDALDADREKWAFILGEKNQGVLSSTRDAAIRAFGQSAAYAVKICERQYRVCCYSLTLSGTYVRLIRWDRAGAIVTERFCILAEPELLCRFFWRFAHVSTAARGYDLTVNAVTGVQEKLFLATVKAHIKTQLSSPTPEEINTALNTHYMPNFVTSIRHKFPLPDSPSEGHPALLVSRPMCSPISMVGRSTRAYWAVPANGTLEGGANRGQVFVLKDTWRIAGPGDQAPELEGDILMSLKQQKVPNIIPVQAHGDVPIVNTLEGEPELDALGAQVLQVTLTDQFIDQWWVCGRRDVLRQKIIKRVHYRLLLGFAGFNLLHMASTAELLSATYDAFQASKYAYEVANRLHRDVTPANIILYHDPLDERRSNKLRQGYLIDWDQSLDCAKPRDGVLEHLPSLSWQFVSERISAGQTGSHQLIDDMESYLYVVLYCGLVRLPHSLNFVETKATIDEMLDKRRLVDDQSKLIGGTGKLSNMRRRLFTGVIIWEAPAMQTWIDTMCDYLSPMRDAPPDRIHKWTAPDLDQFWSTFLRSTCFKSLPSRDRVNLIAKNLQYFGRSAPHSVVGIPSTATMSAGSKRRWEPEPLEEPPSAPKRQRVEPQYDAGTSYVTTSPPSELGTMDMELRDDDSPAPAASSSLLQRPAAPVDRNSRSHAKHDRAGRRAQKKRTPKKKAKAKSTAHPGNLLSPKGDPLSALNICKREYQKLHPQATLPEFERYHKKLLEHQLSASELHEDPSSYN